MRHKALARCPHHRVIQLELSIVDLRLQVINPSNRSLQLTARTKVALDQLVHPRQITLGGQMLGLERLEPVLERRRVDAKQHITLGQHFVTFYRHLDHFAGDHRYHRHRDKIRPRHL
ncbi:hypothetical protein D3C77_520070 [compost metagenome]